MINDACAHVMPMPNACLTPGCYKLSLPRRDPRDAGVPTRADRPARNVWRSSQLPLEGPHLRGGGLSKVLPRHPWPTSSDQVHGRAPLCLSGVEDSNREGCNTLGVKLALSLGIP